MLTDVAQLGITIGTDWTVEAFSECGYFGRVGERCVTTKNNLARKVRRERFKHVAGELTNVCRLG